MKNNVKQPSCKQIVDILYRKFKWELRQIIQEFGLDNLPDTLRLDLKNNERASFKEFEILHAVEPENEGLGPAKQSRRKKTK